MVTWRSRVLKRRRAARRSEAWERAAADPPRHPVELGRIFVHETQPTIALHQLWEMERRGE